MIELFAYKNQMGKKSIKIVGVTGQLFEGNKRVRFGGISLGNTIIVYQEDENVVKHEYGHQIQSMYLGPLYLIVIGLPSIIWAGLIYGHIVPRKPNGYYKFYTESWADKLGGVIRN